MGIAKMLTLSDLLLPLHAFANRWMPMRREHAKSMRYVAIRPSWLAGSTHPANVRPCTNKTLRVSRLIDAQSPFASSRLVISGRMDEVCAELARLAALESHDMEQRSSHLH